jgi:T4 RnlA family RNA ligase
MTTEVMMNYQFPQNITLDEVRQAIRNANERLGTNIFIEADRDPFVIFNYAFSIPDLFPSPTTGDAALDREYAILRECRGLTFHKQTGTVAARKFHKFFNVNEKPETQQHTIDWNAPHIVLTKEDGSMITPVVTDPLALPWKISGRNAWRIEWHTKMGNTEVAQKVLPFVERNPNYADFAHFCLDNQITPMFEWCSRSQRIVLDYPEDHLILLAARHNLTGEYFPYGELVSWGLEFGVEVVGDHGRDLADVSSFLHAAHQLQGIEGFVIRFDTGHMVKVKTDEYCAIHGTISDLVNEKNVLNLLVTNTLDDALPLLPLEDQERVMEFARSFHEGLDDTVIRIAYLAQKGTHGRPAQRDFAEWVQNNVEPILAPHVFRFARMPVDIVIDCGTGDLRSEVKDGLLRTVAKHLGSGPRIDQARTLWGGHRWQWHNQTDAD